MDFYFQSTNSSELLVGIDWKLLSYDIFLVVSGLRQLATSRLLRDGCLSTAKRHGICFHWTLFAIESGTKVES